MRAQLSTLALAGPRRTTEQTCRVLGLGCGALPPRCSCCFSLRSSKNRREPNACLLKLRGDSVSSLDDPLSLCLSHMWYALRGRVRFVHRLRRQTVQLWWIGWNSFHDGSEQCLGCYGGRSNPPTRVNNE